MLKVRSRSRKEGGREGGGKIDITMYCLVYIPYPPAPSLTLGDGVQS